MENTKNTKPTGMKLSHAIDIINQSPVVAIQWKNSKGWPVAFASENIIRLFGYSAEEFVSGKVSYDELIHPEDHERVKKEVGNAIKDRNTDNFTHQPYRIYTKETGIRWIEDRTTIVREANGAIAQFQGIIFDITDKIASEAAMKRSREALKESEEKIQSYQKLFEDSNNEIFFFDVDSYKFIDVNKAALNNLGFTEEEIRGLTPYDITSEFNKEDFNKLVQGLKNLTKTKLIFSTIHKRKNGTTYPVEMNLQLSSYGDISAFAAISFDISDRVKAEDTLRIHRDQLEETVKQRTNEIEKQSKKLEESQRALTFLLEDMNVAREKREETNIKLIDANKDLESFSYSVSHDLRAPLRAIVGFSAKFNSQYNTIIDDEGKRLLDVISKNAMKMGRLIDDLLTFSRMSRTEIRKLNVNMRSLADEAWMEVAEQASGRDIQIEFKALPDLKGDRNMLKQVYVNLFSNAIKFSKPAELNVIEVGADLEDGKCIFYVKDNGVGFDMKYIEKLFQVFQRLHSEKEFEGTGVGLALVHRIIKKHEGEIWAESEPDKGAKFSFILPA